MTSVFEARTRRLNLALCLLIALDGVGVISGMFERSLLSDLAAGSIPEADIMTKAEQNDLRQQIVGLGQLGAYIVTTVLAGMWIHSANKRARSTGVDGMTFTPGWSVGWYFIPIANL